MAEPPDATASPFAFGDDRRGGLVAARREPPETDDDFAGPHRDGGGGGWASDVDPPGRGRGGRASSSDDYRDDDEAAAFGRFRPGRPGGRGSGRGPGAGNGASSPSSSARRDDGRWRSRARDDDASSAGGDSSVRNFPFPGGGGVGGGVGGAFPPPAAGGDRRFRSNVLPSEGPSAASFGLDAPPRDMRNHPKPSPFAKEKDSDLEALGGYSARQNRIKFADRVFGPRSSEEEGGWQPAENPRRWRDRNVGSETIREERRSRSDDPDRHSAHRPYRARQNGFLRRNAALLAIVAALMSATVIGYVFGGSAWGGGSGTTTTDAKQRGLVDRNDDDMMRPPSPGIMDGGIDPQTSRSPPAATAMVLNGNIDGGAMGGGLAGQRPQGREGRPQHEPEVDWSKVPPHLRGYYAKMLGVDDQFRGAAQSPGGDRGPGTTEERGERARSAEEEERMQELQRQQAERQQAERERDAREETGDEGDDEPPMNLAVPAVDPKEFRRQQDELERNPGTGLERQREADEDGEERRDQAAADEGGIDTEEQQAAETIGAANLQQQVQQQQQQQAQEEEAKEKELDEILSRIEREGPQTDESQRAEQLARREQQGRAERGAQEEALQQQAAEPQAERSDRQPTQDQDQQGAPPTVEPLQEQRGAPPSSELPAPAESADERLRRIAAEEEARRQRAEEGNLARAATAEEDLRAEQRRAILGRAEERRGRAEEDLGAAGEREVPGRRDAAASRGAMEEEAIQQRKRQTAAATGGAEQEAAERQRQQTAEEGRRLPETGWDGAAGGTQIGGEGGPVEDVEKMDEASSGPSGSAAFAQGNPPGGRQA